MKDTHFYAERCGSPVGDLWLVANAQGALVELLFHEGRYASTTKQNLEKRFAKLGIDVRWEPSALQAVKDSLAEYFAGERQSFAHELAPMGTDFQKRVWQELQEIPYGSTISYGTLAANIGQPKASRAVGLANGKNPISILIPCHRVIGKDGSLTGYAGGMHNKEHLLRLEGLLAVLACGPPSLSEQS